jgi:hypothetical protein
MELEVEEFEPFDVDALEDEPVIAEEGDVLTINFCLESFPGTYVIGGNK